LSSEEFRKLSDEEAFALCNQGAIEDASEEIKAGIHGFDIEK